MRNWLQRGTGLTIFGIVGIVACLIALGTGETPDNEKVRIDREAKQAKERSEGKDLAEKSSLGETVTDFWITTVQTARTTKGVRDVKDKLRIASR